MFSKQLFAITVLFGAMTASAGVLEARQDIGCANNCATAVGCSSAMDFDCLCKLPSSKKKQALNCVTSKCNISESLINAYKPKDCWTNVFIEWPEDAEQPSVAGDYQYSRL